MTHVDLLQSVSHVAVDAGLFGDIDPSAPILAEAPIVTLRAGDSLEGSRSGEPLLIVPIQGTLLTTRNGTTSIHSRGAVIGAEEMMVPGRVTPIIRAETDSVLLLVDGTRLAHLVDLSPRFCQTLSRALVRSTADDRTLKSGTVRADILRLNEAVPADVGCVLLVQLINQETIAHQYGQIAVDHAMQGLESAVQQSIRPFDLHLRLASQECVVCLHGDAVSGSIVSRRLLARAARVVIFGDMRTPLPHLQIAVGIAVPEKGDTLNAAVSRARPNGLK